MSDDPNPFQILGVEPVFQVDEQTLQARYLKLSGEHHPDRFTDPAEQAEAAERAAAINEAYHVLLDPEQRANALLDLLGGPSAAQDKSLPQDLLSEMMEIRERQEQAVESGDEQKMNELMLWATRQRDIHLKRIGMLFEMATTGDRVQEEKLEIIRLELNALRYFQRMIEQLPVL